VITFSLKFRGKAKKNKVLNKCLLESGIIWWAVIMDKVINFQSKEQKILKHKSSFWADFNRMTALSRKLEIGTESIVEDVFAAIKRDLKEEKISGQSAATMLTQVVNCTTKLEGERRRLYKDLMADGGPITKDQSESVVDKQSTANIRKEAESLLTEVIKKKLSQEAV
jgi:hypothetical protein